MLNTLDFFYTDGKQNEKKTKNYPQTNFFVLLKSY